MLGDVRRSQVAQLKWFAERVSLWGFEVKSDQELKTLCVRKVWERKTISRCEESEVCPDETGVKVQKGGAKPCLS